MLSLEELLCHVDDFCQWCEPVGQQQVLADGVQRRRSRSLLSEVMTILIACHQSASRNFKWFYTQLCRYWGKAFPGLGRTALGSGCRRF